MAGEVRLDVDGAIATITNDNPGKHNAFDDAMDVRLFEVLAERQINLLAVSSSEIKVSALIAEAELELAVRVLHTAFGLDAEQAA